jgi:methyl-accepting chemotaxis protein
MQAQDFMWLAIGVSSLAIAAGLSYALLKFAKVLDRTVVTLEKVDAQLDGLGGPINQTLASVSGVAGNVERLSGRVERVAELIESTAGAIAKTADAAQAAVSPTVASVVGIVAGVTQGAKTFFGAHKRGNGRA